MFGRRDQQPSEAALDSLVDAIPTGRVELDALADGAPVVDVLVGSGVASSKGEARRLLGQGGVTCNGQRAGTETIVTSADLWYGRFILVRRGKKHVHVVVAE